MKLLLDTTYLMPSIGVSVAARSKIDDFVDCLILCSAVTAADALVSEDEAIRAAMYDESFRASLAPSNPAFTVYTSRSIP